MEKVQELRKLAAWYREFAEKAGSPWIWDARLRHAITLEEEATRRERHLAPTKPEPSCE
jgi:hypothetical protein